MCAPLAKAQVDWWSRSNRAPVCIVNPLYPTRFRTQEVNERLVDFLVRLGNLRGECNENCLNLCGDNDACTIDDDDGSCEERGCTVLPRKTVDCGAGYTCDSSLGCIIQESLPEPGSDSPSGSPSSPPNETPSPSTSSLPPSFEASNSPSSFQTRTCSDNAMVFGVNVDIQIDFSGSTSFPACTDGQWDQIETKIRSTMANSFATVVPDWNGDVSFGAVSFDDDQQVSNARRLLRGQEQHHRSLNTHACSSERSIPCEKEFCYWGCLVAPTTSCGTNSLTNWLALGEKVQYALASLGYECLGSANDLVTNILVVDPSEP